MSSVEIIIDDCRLALKRMAAESVQACVTSPPYFGLRDYGTAEWVGGDPGCSHVRLKGESETLEGSNYSAREIFRDECPMCGARREDGQIGLEPTPVEFVQAMVDVFAEVRRVLRPDGCLFLNLGDSYAGSWGAQGNSGGTALGQRQTKAMPKITSGAGKIPEGSGLKPKDLIGIPWRTAFALQDDGWWLRQELIWHKTNPMPESVMDRCTKAHEQVFLLTKSGRPTVWRARDTMEWSYAPDHRERAPRPTVKRPDAMAPRWIAFDYFFDVEAIAEEASYQPGGSHDDVAQGGFNDKGPIPGTNQRAFRAIRETRRKRSVWSLGSEPFGGDHFATMPSELARTAILASSRPGDLILDPFGGAGTTALAAQQLQRRAVLIELNPRYAAMAAERLRTDAGLLADVRVA